MLYLDTAATTAVDPRVAEVVLRLMTDEFGNAGSRTHEWGSRAKRVVQDARETVASVANVGTDEITFTSGATESNNIALLGLAEHGRATNRRHIISSAIEHKAVIEPLEYLATQGFEVEFLSPGTSGRFSAADVLARVRPDTLVVSMMHVNNETGVTQPVAELAEALVETPALLHVDAAQGFAKLGDVVANAPIDLMSVSGHKLGSPKGVGVLVTRRRGWNRVPLSPIMYGGGQERGLRPGTIPVPLVAGVAEAAKLMRQEHFGWFAGVTTFRQSLLEAFQGIDHSLNGDQAHCAPHILNVSFHGIDSEAVVLGIKDVAAVATGSACTSASYTPSHVLTAMGLPEERVNEAIRMSWWSDTDATQLPALRDALMQLSR